MILSIYFFVRSSILKSLEIMNDVWIGINAIILSRVYSGKNSVIETGSVVTRYFDKNLVVEGTPEKSIKKLTQNEGIR